MKKPLREFDDLDHELIDSLVRILSTMLQIKGKVIVADREQMISLYYSHLSKKEQEKELAELDYIFGSTFPEDRVMYLNPRLCKRSYQSLIETTIHELLHIKYPTYTEDQIQKLERSLTGRYDYVIKKDLPKSGKEMRTCKVITFD